MHKVNKKIRMFTGLVLTALGGGLVFASAGDMLSANADSSTPGATSPTLLVIFFVGVFLIAAGIMSALFLFSSAPTGGRNGRA